MSTKKSAVDELRGTLINVNLDKGAFKFSIGDEIKPDWEITRTVMRKLYLLGYASQILGGTDDALVLVSGNREQLEYYVPLLCRAINANLETGKYEATEHPGLIAIAYILAWYWYHSLHGPKPIYNPARHSKKISVRIEFRCPVCTKEYVPPARLVRIEAKYNSYIKWLSKHGREYHKEWRLPNVK